MDGQDPKCENSHFFLNDPLPNANMIFLIIDLGRHLVMYQVPERKSFKRAPEVLEKWEKVFFQKVAPKSFSCASDFTVTNVHLFFSLFISDIQIKKPNFLLSDLVKISKFIPFFPNLLCFITFYFYTFFGLLVPI